MGVVMRQGLKYAMITYVFMAVSIVASIKLYPLDIDFYGVIIFLIDTTMIVLPIILLGLGTVSVKFFPEMSAVKNGRSILLVSAGLTILVTSSVIGIVGWLCYPYISSLFESKSTLLNLEECLWVLLPLIVLVAFQNYLTVFTSNYKRIAFPNLLQNTIRVSVPIIFLLVIFDVIEPKVGLYLLVVHYFLVVCVLWFYLKKLDTFAFNLVDKSKQFLLRKDVQTFAIFATLSSVGSNFAFKIDSFMITSMLDTGGTGTYSIGNKIGTIIAVPTAAILGIVAPLVSAAISKNDIGSITSLYKRSSEILTIAGVIMLAGLAVVVEDIFTIMHDGDLLVANGAMQVVVYVAVSRFFDSITSINGQIIGLSEYFKYNLIFLLFLAIMNIILNFIFIKQIGIVGAAVASFISLTLYNLIKILFIKRKFGIWPFSLTHVVIVVMGTLSALAVIYSGTLLNLPVLVNMGIKGFLVSAILISLLYFFNVSKDFNHVIDVAQRRVLGFFKKT